MSTRGAIIFIGPDTFGGSVKALRLYQHCDTYPTNILPVLKDVLKATRKKAEEHHTDHIAYRMRNVPFKFETCIIPAELLAGVYIGETTTGFGLSAHIEHSMGLRSAELGELDAGTLSELFGNHGDLEWVYVVNSIDRSIRVFGGGFTGELPETFFKQGTVNPECYSEDLVEDYRDKALASIKSATRSLNRIGFPVNPARQSGRRAAIAEQRARVHGQHPTSGQ